MMTGNDIKALAKVVDWFEDRPFQGPYDIDAVDEAQVMIDNVKYAVYVDDMGLVNVDEVKA